MADLLSKEVEYEVNGEEVRLTGKTVKQCLTRGSDKITDQEVMMFISLCKYQKLNPFLNEAYIVKYKDYPAQIITSKEAYMKKAERTKGYEGMQAGIIIQRGKEILEVEGCFCLETDVLLGGWCKVYKRDRKYPYVIKVNFGEYNKGKNTWLSMPKTMIRKVAIVQALREAFPEDLGALYTEEEQIQPTINQEVQQEIKENGAKKVIDIGPEQIQPEPKQIEKKEQKTIDDVVTTQAIEKVEEGPGF